MSTPFMGQIEIFSFNFAPKGWALCNGQLLPINQNQALFSLLGTTFGGDGRVNFALPDMRSRIPVSMGPQNIIGTQAGQEAHTLILGELPAHNHFVGVEFDRGRRQQAGDDDGVRHVVGRFEHRAAARDQCL